MTDQWGSRAHRVWQSVRKDTPVALSDPDSHDDGEVAAMLRELGIALLEVEQPTQLVVGRLIKIGANYTRHKVRVVALPTALVIQVGSVGYEVEVSNRATIQLDLAGRIDDLADLASVGAITPADAIIAVAAARTMKPRFGAIVTIIGYAVTTVGFGMVINPTWAALPAYLFLGLVVGGVVLLGRPFPSLNPILPTLSAALVTMLATWFVADAANDGLLRVISPPLVAMLPGMSITIGSMELASSEIVAGASRLIYGVTQLMLLVFGVALGMHVAGRVEPAGPVAADGHPGRSTSAIVVVAIGTLRLPVCPAGLAAVVGRRRRGRAHRTAGGRSRPARVLQRGGRRVPRRSRSRWWRPGSGPRRPPSC